VRLESDGRVTLMERPVTAAVNDRFCLNLVSQYDWRVDLARFATMNRCFLAGSDKGVAYCLLNEHLDDHPGRHFPRRVQFARARSGDELVATVLAWLQHGRRTVIKPQGTGLGHGIEFFLAPDEPPEQVAARIDASLGLTEKFYRSRG